MPSKFRPKFLAAIDTPEEYDKLRTPNPYESEEQKSIALRYVDKLRMPYKDVPRTRWTGPSSLNTSFELREDMYSVVFLYKLKRMTFYGDNVAEVARTRRFASETEIQRATNTEINKRSSFYKDFQSYRKSMTGKWRFMLITQLLLIWFLGYEAVTSEDT